MAAPAEESQEMLLEIEGLRVHFETEAGDVPAVRGVSLEIAAGETLALVGESGCGKSVTALSVLRLVGEPGRLVAGAVRFRGRDLAELSVEEVRAVRGGEIGMIFQEPMTSLNPVFPIGDQIAEVLQLHRGLEGEAVRQEVVRLLERVQIPAAARRVDQYPHELSGGMKQRVMIAMALACDPALLIADEPTTALDVTIQAQILGLLAELQRDLGMAVLLITHDLGVVAHHADRVAVMYAGEIVEEAPVGPLYADPRHPYTRALLAALPRRGDRGTLTAIEGTVPSPRELPAGCAFSTRCPAVLSRCANDPPPVRHSPGRATRCWLEEAE
ncbi:MAG: ABC transporter ATP-binding protein [Myxococcota bacterium]